MSEQQGEYITQNEIDDAKEMLGAGYEHRVKDESNDHRYFIITPRIIKAHSRNPYDLALWDTIKEIAGDSGECYLNTKQLAALSGMSMGKASDSRKHWIELGFLKGEIRQDPGYPQPVWHITVPDLWQKNIEWCEKHPKIQDRIDFMESFHSVKASPGEQGLSPREQRPTPHETKKINKKNEKDILDGILEYQVHPKAVRDAIAQYFRLTPNWEAKYNRQFMEWAVEIKMQPEQVKYAADLWRSDKRFNWQAPTLRGIQEHWMELSNIPSPVQSKPNYLNLEVPNAIPNPNPPDFAERLRRKAQADSGTGT